MNKSVQFNLAASLAFTIGVLANLAGITFLAVAAPLVGLGCVISANRILKGQGHE